MSGPLPFRARLTLTDVIRAAPEGFVRDAPFAPHEKKVLFKIAYCGTGELGYYVLECSECRGRAYAPRGCHNRHCPSCKPRLADEWVARQQEDLLPTHYYQVVCSLPPQLWNLALENRKLIYSLFMVSVRDTLLTLAHDEKWLGAEPALLMVVHTWNTRMGYYPHVHCLISAGGYREETDTWVPAKREGFFAPMGIAARLVRGKFMEGLKQLREKDKLTYHAEVNAPLRNRQVWQELVDSGYKERWRVHAERPKGGPAAVLRYLGQYVQRSAISNYRLKALTSSHVTVVHSVRDKKAPRTRFGTYAKNDTEVTYTIAAFLFAWCRHILPRGFHRARRAGLLANARGEVLLRAKAAAARAARRLPVPGGPLRPPRPPTRCPHCGQGHLVPSHAEIRTPLWVRFLNRRPTLPDLQARGPPLRLEKPW